MDVLILLIFTSIVLLVGALILLLKSIKQGDYEHGDRLSLLPLEDDLPVASSRGESTPGGDTRSEPATDR
jgi:hypothetical protein